MPGSMSTPSPTHAGDPVLVALGGAIRTMRKQRGLSQEGLAEDSELERAYMSGIERGVQNLSLMALLRIARALDVSIAELSAAAKI